MKKLCIVLAILFVATGTSFAKTKAGGRAFGPAHRANKGNQQGKKDCSGCDKQHAECMKNAANPQGQGICGTMKQNCQKQRGC